MEFTKDIGHIYAVDDNGKIIAEVDFPDSKDGVCEITHTFVDDSLRGQGVAGKLIDAAVQQIQEFDKKTVPVCPYAVKWFKDHPDMNDILAKK